MPVSANKPVVLAVGCVDRPIITGREQYEVGGVVDEVFAERLKAVEDSIIDIIQIGILATKFQVSLLAEFLAARDAVVVLCPVFGVDDEFDCCDREVPELIRLQLLKLCSLVVLDIHAAESLTRINIRSNDSVVRSAKCILDLGAKAVLVNDVEPSDCDYCTDYFSDSTTAFHLRSPLPIMTQYSFTAGRLASSIAISISRGNLLADAVIKIVTERNRMARQGNQNTSYDQQRDIPLLFIDDSILHSSSSRFPSCGDTELGLYPVVDRADWLERLLPLGVSTIQLRVKDLQGEALKREVARAVEISDQYNCRLFINDYWDLAIECGAYGVHLGQEDLDSASLTAILAAGLRLGLSSHCHYEVARCLAIRPSYIAVGPVFPTTTKIMPWSVHGIAGLSYWQHTLEYPLVAIAGINPDNFAEVVATGVSGVAMITAITQSSHPESTCTRFLNEINQ